MIIFGEPEQARQAIASFQQLYQDYNTLWLEIKKNAKTQKLYGMAQYVTPEYTLPGGRCCAATTYVSYKVGKKEGSATIKDLFRLFEDGKKIRVLSDDNGNLKYSLVKKIWQSGKKLTYNVNTIDANIRLTKEHLVYMPNEGVYKPTELLNKGDEILVYKNGELVKEKLLSKPKAYKVEEVYDMEVPGTENFVGNNILSHNSRWFRYLYKSGSGG
jgi:hypothetical protein